MKKDKLQVWALCAEIIGGIAVVVSLGIVAFELRQSTNQAKLNTNALEITAYQSLITSIVDFNSQITTEPDLADIQLSSQKDPSSLSPQERHRLDAFYRGIIRHGDMAYFQYQRGAIDIERLNSALSPVRVNIALYPIAREEWNRIKYAYDKDFVEHLDRLVSETQGN